MRYRVLLADNFHFGEEGVEHGEYASHDEAVAECRRILDEELAWYRRPGMTAADLYEGWIGFGSDPFVSPDDGKARFSAREYAWKRCQEICSDSA